MVISFFDIGTSDDIGDPTTEIQGFNDAIGISRILSVKAMKRDMTESMTKQTFLARHAK